MKNNGFLSHMIKRVHARARLCGNDDYPLLEGVVEFSQTKAGVLIFVYVTGLPKSGDVCQKPIFAMHIHSGGSCTGNEEDMFADAMGHYNPHSCAHPYHAGDMPPLFGSSGLGVCMFLTDRFTVAEVVGKTVIIHSHPDDFVTQPSGNPGQKIACGVISKL